MNQRVPISAVAQVNPTMLNLSGRDRSQLVSFVPMAAVSEAGELTVPEQRPLKDVLKGFRYFEKGDVLLAKITPCMENGKAAFVEYLPTELGFGSTEFHVVRPGPDLDGRYLFYLLWNPSFRFVAERNMTGTAGQKRVSSGFLERYEIPLPPLPEQRRIAAILDKADSIRRKRQQALELTEEFLRSVFLEMFGDVSRNTKGWPVLTLGDVCESRLGKMLDAKQQTGKHLRPYLRNLNVQWGRLDLTTVFEMDFDEKDRGEFRLRAGDVLTCEGGAGVGQTAIWRDELTECYYQKSLHRIRPHDEHATPEYIAYLIRTMMRGDGILRSIATATIPHLTGVKLKGLQIPVPPVPLQRVFGEIWNQLDRSRDRLNMGVAESARFFNSLVQRAFRGELSENSVNQTTAG